MKRRKKFTGAGVIVGAVVAVYIAFGIAKLVTPAEIVLPDGNSINVPGCIAGSKELIEARGVDISRMDLLAAGTTPGQYIYERPRPVLFRGPDGFARRTFTHARTVGEFLASAGIELGEHDIVEPSVDSRIPLSGEIRLSRGCVERITVEEEIPCEVILEAQADLPCGEEQIVNQGYPGRKLVTYDVISENNKEVERVVVRENVLIQPVAQHSLVGTRVEKLDDVKLRARDIMWMDATAYDPGPESNGIWTGKPTAYGLTVGYGVVAVDPRIIPLGTRLYIEGYGYAIAGDTGGAIKNFRIDLGYNSRSEAMKFGRREVKVYILDDSSKV